MDSFRRLILPVFIRIGVKGRRHFGCTPVVTLRVSYRPFEDLRAVSAPFEDLRVRQAHPTSKYPEEDRGAVSLSNRSNRFMAQTALKPHLMLANDNFLD